MEKDGAEYTVKKVDATGNSIIINTVSGTIDGAATYSLVLQYNSVTFVSNRTSWLIIAKV